VLIGQGLDRRALEAMLDEALLTDGEYREGVEAWKNFPDPFPKWG
jgi:hypothetical protein